MSPTQGDNGQSQGTIGAHSKRLSYSLQSGIAFLQMFSEKRQSLGVAEMADLTGLSRPTTHRYVSTLLQLGFLEQDPKRKYRLAAGAAAPGAAVIHGIRRSLPARAVLEELRDWTGYTVSMGALDGTRAVYVHRLFGHRRGQHMIDRELRVGAHIPAYCTALGKAMLAGLSEAERRERVAAIHFVPEGPRSITTHDKLLDELSGMNLRAPILSDEEFVMGARSIAMLLSWPSGEYPMAIDVTVPSGAYTAKQLLKEIGPGVMRAAKLISQV